jgi:hypothetical protein
MGMARLAEAMIDRRDERVVPLVHLNSSRIGEALRLARMQAENDVGAATDRDDEISGAVEQIRAAAALRHSSERRIRELEAALETAREEARKDLESAEERADEAEAKALAEAERAASAERRLRLVEDRLSLTPGER